MSSTSSSEHEQLLRDEQPSSSRLVRAQGMFGVRQPPEGSDQTENTKGATNKLGALCGVKKQSYTVLKTDEALIADESETTSASEGQIKYSTDTSISYDYLNDSDSAEYLHCHTGELVFNRYEVKSVLGQGAFGRVYSAADKNEQNQMIALKTIRKNKAFSKIELNEIKILTKIKAIDPEGIHLCTILLDWFFFRNHACMVINLLDISLYDFMRKNKFNLSFQLTHIRHIAYQICHAVGFLHQHEIIHTDVKPENIMLVCGDSEFQYDKVSKRNICCPRYTNVRIVDFSGAINCGDPCPMIISTTPYRAPEVFMELGWSKPADLWSIATVLFKLYTTETLFDTDDNAKHLAMMEKTLGQIPINMAKASKSKFFRSGKLVWNENSEAAAWIHQSCKPLISYRSSDHPEHVSFFDLLDKMLRYDPQKRITAQQAKLHKFFDEILVEQRMSYA